MTSENPQGDLLGGPPTSESEAPKTEPVKNDWHDFDWQNSPDVIIREQRAIAVYTNPYGGVVVREERGWDEEEDRFIVLSSPEATGALIAALKRKGGRR